MNLTVDGLSKDYGSLRALRNVDLRIEFGDSQAIIGPNGAGKTTFFNILAGVTEPTSGSIYLGDEEITGSPPHEIARHGLVKTFQQTRVFEEETVFENVRIGAQMRHSTYNMISKASALSAVNETAKETIERLNLSAHSDTRVGGLPYGEKRKVELGIALATEPSILLLDEPTAGMSHDGIQDVIDVLENLLEDPELTVILTEHNMDLVLELVDFITVFNKGEILSEGPPDEIIADDTVQEVYLGG